MRFTIATYNIHKGFSHLTRRMVIHELRERLRGLAADILFLQEVIGVHERHAGRYRDWPRTPALHCINVHLGLFERGRQWQIRAMCERIRETVPKDAPLVIAGDFNDWRHKANRALVDDLGVSEVFEAVKGRAARTFPSVMPVFRLDRIYARGLRIVDARVHYAFPGGGRMSDHAALAATFETVKRGR